MKPQVVFGGYFEIDTTCGLEVVPVDVCGRLANVDVSYFADYLEGRALDDDEVIECHDGWLARLAAPGYMDCTHWTRHESEEAAAQYLMDTYGDEYARDMETV